MLRWLIGGLWARARGLRARARDRYRRVCVWIWRKVCDRDGHPFEAMKLCMADVGPLGTMLWWYCRACQRATGMSCILPPFGVNPCQFLDR